MLGMWVRDDEREQVQIHRVQRREPLQADCPLPGVRSGTVGVAAVTRDGPEERADLPEGQVQCDRCGLVASEEQILVKRTSNGEPDVKLCPVCQ